MARWCEWRCEMRSVNSLRRSGWTADMFRVGSTIDHHRLAGAHQAGYCYLGTIVSPTARTWIAMASGSCGGRHVEAGSEGTAHAHAPRACPTSAGDWAAEQRVMSDPRGQSGTLVPLSDAAKMQPGELPAGQTAFPRRARIGGIPRRGSGQGRVGSSHAREAHATGQGAARRSIPPRATIRACVASPRTSCSTGHSIPWSIASRRRQHASRMQIRPHGPGARDPPGPEGRARRREAARAGYSIGRWEGDTLVVETSAFLPAC